MAVLVIATSSQSGRATCGSDEVGPVTFPPVVEYSRDVQARAAEELMLLTEPSAVNEMLSDFAVMREQARACETRA